MRPQVDYLCNEHEEVLVDFVGKFETLHEDFQYVCDKIGVKKTLRHARKTKHKHYSAYYDSKTIEIVESLYQKDIELFDYKFEYGKGRHLSYYLTYLPDEARRAFRKIRNLVSYF